MSPCWTLAGGAVGDGDEVKSLDVLMGRGRGDEAGSSVIGRGVGDRAVSSGGRMMSRRGMMVGGVVVAIAVS